MRRLFFSAALLASLFLLLVWAAGVDWQSPLSPDTVAQLVGVRFPRGHGRRGAG